MYEDKDLLVVNKPSGLLTISTNKEQFKTLYHEVFEYLRKKNQKVFIVHRLDKETSGIVVFAKSEKMKFALQDKWDNTKRYYYAIVIGKAKANDSIKSYLGETKTLLTYITNKNYGKEAITNYKLIEYKNNHSLIDIEIKTGRKNQIRVQLNSKNLPILGDLKYGNSKYKHMCLHAYKLEFVNPKTKKLMVFESKKPSYFNI